jgi:hypothetical protein
MASVPLEDIMKYVVCKSVVWVVGKIWMPAVTCGQTITLTAHDVENCRDDDGKITRDSVSDWIDSNAGDFQSITDFSASIEDGDATIDIPWATEAGEMAFMDATSEEDE